MISMVRNAGSFSQELRLECIPRISQLQIDNDTRHSHYVIPEWIAARSAIEALGAQIVPFPHVLYAHIPFGRYSPCMRFAGSSPR